MEYTELNKIPGIMVLIDFEKAFDTLEWQFLHKQVKISDKKEQRFGDIVTPFSSSNAK